MLHDPVLLYLDGSISRARLPLAIRTSLSLHRGLVSTLGQPGEPLFLPPKAIRISGNSAPQLGPSHWIVRAHR